MTWPRLRRSPGRLLQRLPRVVLEVPERILINLACALVGLSVLVGTRSPALTKVRPFPLYQWGLLTLLGGSAVLVGLFARKGRVERLGMGCVLLGCLFYGGLLLWVFHWQGVITALIFFASASAK